VSETQAVIRRIRQGNRQYAIAILMLGFKTLMIPILVLVLCSFLSALVIGRVQEMSGSQPVYFVTSAVSFIVTVLVTRYAWRWSDARFKGWTLWRTIGEVNGGIRRMERTPTGDMTARAQSVWQTYVEAMQAAGFPLNGD
jgi:hypothetical protein